MRFGFRLGLLLLLVAGTLTQDGFDLGDALDPVTPAKPKDVPTPTKPPVNVPEKPKDGGGGLDLFDALAPDPTTKPKKPSSGDSGGGGGFNLEDAFGPDPIPDKPAVNKPKAGGGGGGGSFDDSDLFDVGGGSYEPDGGKVKPREPQDPGYNPSGGADQPQEAGSGKIAGIVSAIGVALLGAASSYFAYQKKKLCFKMQGGADPESGKVQQGQYGQHSDPQVFSNLLKTS